MSKIFKIVFTILLITNNSCSNGQSKQECQDMLDDNIALLEHLLNNDKHVATDFKEMQAAFSNQPYQKENKTKFDETYHFHKGYPPLTEYIYPNTYIKLKFDIFNIAHTLDKDYPFTMDFINNIDQAIFKLKKIYFLDGSVQDQEIKIVDKIVSEQFGDQTLVLSGTKPIKSFDYSMETHLNKEVSYEITKTGQRIATSAGSIEVIHCGNGYVRIKTSEPMRHLVRILAIDEKGRQLTTVAAEQRNAYKKDDLRVYIANMEQAKALLDKDEITCAEVRQKYSSEKLNTELDGMADSLFLTQYFVSDFKEASIVFWDNAKVVKQVYERNSADQSDLRPEDFYEACSCVVAQDKRSELYGLIGLDGNWIIEPKFLELEAQWGTKGLFWAQTDADEKRVEYVFDKENIKLTKTRE